MEWRDHLAVIFLPFYSWAGLLSNECVTIRSLLQRGVKFERDKREFGAAIDVLEYYLLMSSFEFCRVILECWYYNEFNFYALTLSGYLKTDL